MTKVAKELERLQSVVSSTGYQIKAKEAVKSKHVEQVSAGSQGKSLKLIPKHFQIKQLELKLKKLKDELE